eukprot:355354-Prorocentrum_minimum.AAC.1
MDKSWVPDPACDTWRRASGKTLNIVVVGIRPWASSLDQTAPFSDPPLQPRSLIPLTDPFLRPPSPTPLSDNPHRPPSPIPLSDPPSPPFTCPTQTLKPRGMCLVGGLLGQRGGWHLGVGRQLRGEAVFPGVGGACALAVVGATTTRSALRVNAIAERRGGRAALAELVNAAMVKQQGQRTPSALAAIHTQVRHFAPEGHPQRYCRSSCANNGKGELKTPETRGGTRYFSPGGGVGHTATECASLTRKRARAWLCVCVCVWQAVVAHQTALEEKVGAAAVVDVQASVFGGDPTNGTTEAWCDAAQRIQEEQ